MTDQPLCCVVDASVAIKLFVDQPFSDRAIALFSQLEIVRSAQFHVPDLFYVECANVLWRYVRVASYPADRAREGLARLKRLALQSATTSDLITNAFDLALAHRISAYDACYVELAQRLNIPLITADQKLVQALSSTPYAVYSLETFSILR